MFPRRRVPALLVGLVALFSALAACGGAGSANKPTSPGTIPLLTVGMAESITNLDHSIANGSFSNVVRGLALEQLEIVGGDGRLHPWLATSMTHPDPVTYVYHLRHGVKFWDGDELTAADVAYSLNYYRRPGSVEDSYYLTVNSIKAAGRYTVVVTLKHPDASWPITPAIGQGIFEEKFQQAHPRTFGQPGALIMGSGPWKFDSLDPTRGVELSANPHWWGGTVPIKHISVKFFSDENSEALAYRAGELDLVPQIQDVQSFTATAGTTTVNVPSCANAFISMPTNTAPWSDVHVRRAVAYAVNRPDLIKATGFAAEPSYTLIAPSELGLFDPQSQVNAALASVRTYPYNLAEAKKEMAQSATPHGFNAVLETFHYGSFLNVDQVIAAELEQIGINVQIKNIGQNAWFAAIEDPRARPFTYTTSGDCGLDPNYWNQYLGSNVFNIANYAPPEVNRLLAAGTATSDPTRRLSIYAQLLQRLGTDVPYVPLLTQDASFASGKLTWPGYNLYWFYRAWALDLRAK